LHTQLKLPRLTATQRSAVDALSRASWFFDSKAPVSSPRGTGA